jgi:hypothetical protein
MLTAPSPLNSCQLHMMSAVYILIVRFVHGLLGVNLHALSFILCYEFNSVHVDLLVKEMARFIL